jgi:chitinase
VTLSEPSATRVTVQFGTQNVTATNGQDYVARNGTLTFNPGQMSKTVTVLVNGDTRLEPDERFNLNLFNAAGAGIDDGTGVGTILNDDPAPPPPPKVFISINDESDFERDAGLVPITFKLTLDRASTRTVSVHFTTANGTATAGSDYNATSGTITFTPGQTRRTVTVFVRGDRVRERDETFFLQLSSPINGMIARGRGRGLIKDDD